MYYLRVKQFFARLQRDFFVKEEPLNVSVEVRAEPLPYEQSFANLPFQKISEGEVWGKQWQSGYFRLCGTIPPEWKGKTVWLHLEMGGEITIFDPAFVPYYGMTNTCIQIPNFRKEFFPLTTCAVPGKFVLYAEVAGNGYNETGEKDCPIGLCQTMRFGVFRREVWDLRNDFRILLSLLRFYNAGNEDEPGGFQTVRRVFCRFNLRAAQLCRCLNDAVNIYADFPDNAAAAREILKKELQRPAQSSMLTTTAVGHGHLDIGYFWSLRETRRKACRTFANQLHNIARYPGYVWGASQPQLYAFVKERSPKLYERVGRAYRAGRWDLQGGMWVEADSNMISGESMVRQFLHGKNFYRDEFGEDVDTHWLPDAFGFSPALPQIMKLAKVKYFLSQKMSWNESNYFPHHSFVWRGHDGSEVLVHFPPCDGYNSFLEPEELRWAEDNYQENSICTEFLTLFGAGDGGGGPLPEHIENGLRDIDLEDCPHVLFGRAADFFHRLEAQRSLLPEWTGELYFEFHRGTLTNRGRMKKLNREMEQLLAAAEMFFSLLPPSRYPAVELDRIWKYFLMTQFHDILPGTSLREVYQEVESQLAAHREELFRLTEEKVPFLLSSDTDGVTFFNTLSVPYRRLLQLPASWHNCAVIDAAGKKLLTQVNGPLLWVEAEIPALSSVTFRRSPEHISTIAAVSSDSLVLENDLIRYEFDADGGLVRAFDKRLKREWIPKGKRGNQFQLYIDQPRTFPASDIDRHFREISPEIARGTAMPTVKRGQLVSTVEFQLQVGTTMIRETVRLFRHSACLDFLCEIEWAQNERMLRVLFPADVPGKEVTSEIQHGFFSRPTHENTSWDEARFEYCMQRYADRSDDRGGVALLNDGKYGFRFFGGAYDVALLRSEKAIDISGDSGTHRFTLNYYPHPAFSTLDPVVAEAAQLNRPPLVFPGYRGELSLPFTFSGEGVYLEACKKAEKSEDLILRFNEQAGRTSTLKIKLRDPKTQLFLCDLLEWEEGTRCSSDSAGTVELPFRPFELKTLRMRQGKLR